MIRPLNCTILAGPNGAGKSSLFEALSCSGPFINADVIAKRIRPDKPESVATEAGRQALKFIDDLLAAQLPFSYETTLSGETALNVMRKAKRASYEVDLAFVILESADMHVDRVKHRVARGGHHVDDAVVLRRYERSLGKLTIAMRIADNTMILDNTSDVPMLLLSIRDGKVDANHLEEAEIHHVRIAEVVADALNMSADAVFRAAKND